MARPKMKFTPAQAVDLINEIELRLEDKNFTRTHLIQTRVDGISMAHQEREQFESLLALCSAAQGSYRRSNEWPVPLTDTVCESLREWLTKYMTPEGWTRFKANLRQKALVCKRQLNIEKRLVPIKSPALAGLLFGELAAGIDMQRPQFIYKLAQWLTYADEGKSAMAKFAAAQRRAQAFEAGTWITEALGLSTQRVQSLGEFVFRDTKVSAEEFLLAVYKKGRPAFVKLAAQHPGVNPEARLTAIVLLYCAPAPSGDVVKG